MDLGFPNCHYSVDKLWRYDFDKHLGNYNYNDIHHFCDDDWYICTNEPITKNKEIVCANCAEVPPKEMIFLYDLMLL